MYNLCIMFQTRDQWLFVPGFLLSLSLFSLGYWFQLFVHETWEFLIHFDGEGLDREVEVLVWCLYIKVTSSTTQHESFTRKLYRIELPLVSLMPSLSSVYFFSFNLWKNRLTTFVDSFLNLEWKPESVKEETAGRKIYQQWKIRFG